MNEAPLLYTTRGNVPADTTDCRVEWTFDARFATCRVKYFAKDTGEMIREDVYVHGLEGVEALSHLTKL